MSENLHDAPRSIDRFERITVECPKCGSHNMETVEVREMWHPNRKEHPPLFGASGSMKIRCYDCGAHVWPDKEAERKIAEKKAKVAV